MTSPPAGRLVDAVLMCPGSSPIDLILSLAPGVLDVKLVPEEGRRRKPFMNTRQIAYLPSWRPTSVVRHRDILGQ